MRLSGFVKPAQTTWHENNLHLDHYRVQ
jgi:hypothetical protein